MARLLFALLGLLSFVLDVSAAATNSSVFVYTDPGHLDASVVFALNVNRQTGDLFFHLSAPSANSWVGVGIGSEMKGSMMFIAYASDNGTGVTISPRLALGESEPAYDDALVVEKQYGGALTDANTVGDTTTVVDAVCRKCVPVISTGLDLTSTTQPFIFALGPTYPLQSDSLTAGLWEHQWYGGFTMDMTQATSADSGAVPVGPYAQTGASAATGVSEDNDPAPHIHGLVMSFVFVLLLPFGSLILRVWNKVKGHIIVQSIALMLFLMAFAGGIVTSLKFNRSKSFNNAHQIIGILLLVAFLSQLGLGVVNHRIFVRTQRGTIMGKIHLYLGPVIILFGLINGFLGFSLADIPQLGIPYAVVIVIVGIIYSSIRFCGCSFCGAAPRANRWRKEPPADPEGFQFPTFDNTTSASVGRETSAAGDGYPLSNAPPAYSASDVRIPLQTYHSSTSVAQMPMQPVEPRGMV